MAPHEFITRITKCFFLAGLTVTIDLDVHCALDIVAYPLQSDMLYHEAYK